MDFVCVCIYVCMYIYYNIYYGNEAVAKQVMQMWGGWFQILE